MTIDFSQPITDLSGQPVREPDGTIATLSLAATSALMLPDSGASESEKLNRFRLAFLIMQSTGPIAIEIQDAAVIKRALGRHPSPLVVGRAFQLLEG